MKRKHISLNVLLLLILSLTLAISACSKNKVLVEIDNSKLTLDDFLYDIFLIKQERDVWNNSYKESLGIDYWDYELEGNTMEQLAKDTIMTRVVLYEVLSDQAKKEGYALNKEDIATIEKNVDNLINSMSEIQLKEAGIDRDILIKAMSKLALGDKYYLATISDYPVDEEAIKSNIDPDEYREYITECLYVPTALVSYQNITPLSEEELSKAFDKILSVKELVEGGADFNIVKEQVPDAIYYERNFIISDNTAEDEYKQAAEALENDDYSDVITTKFGHYIIHMLDNNSTKRYETAIENTIMDDKTKQFKITYDELLKEYDIQINTEYWNSIELDDIASKKN